MRLEAVGRAPSTTSSRSTGNTLLIVPAMEGHHGKAHNIINITLVVGHTKFAPDWCWCLVSSDTNSLRTQIGSLQSIVAVNCRCCPEVRKMQRGTTDFGRKHSGSGTCRKNTAVVPKSTSRQAVHESMIPTGSF